MNNLRHAAVALLLVVAPVLLAQNSGPAANGDFQFTAGNASKSMTFNARIQQNGQVHGQVTISGGEDLGDQDVDGGGDANPGGQHANLTVTADVDCLVINGNRAVISGEITDSSVGSYIGVRMLLVVEDGGEGSKKAPDKFTWGLYRGPTLSWVATDAELTFDPGAGMSWYATDAERDDDAGIPSQPSNPQIGCQSFPLASYDLHELPHGAGNLQVKP